MLTQVEPTHLVVIMTIQMALIITIVFQVMVWVKQVPIIKLLEEEHL